MQLTVAAIGRLRGGPELELIDRYSTRIRALARSLGVSRFDIKEFDAPKELVGDKRRMRESEMLAKAARLGAKRVVLDESGENLSSAKFAEQIARWRDAGVSEIIFMIGGAPGHDMSLAAQADLVVAFGRATFPHLLVRAMLVEQIYRAMTILACHPYHRE